MLNDDDKNKDKFEGDEDMAILYETVNNVQQICTIKRHITDIRVRLLETISKLTMRERENENKLEYITFNLDELSEDEIMFLNMFHMMEDDQNNFAEGITHINYEGLMVDEYKDSSSK